jgi:hypothetical protein
MKAVNTVCPSHGRTQNALRVGPISGHTKRSEPIYISGNDRVTRGSVWTVCFHTPLGVKKVHAHVSASDFSRWRSEDSVPLGATGCYLGSVISLRRFTPGAILLRATVGAGIFLPPFDERRLGHSGGESSRCLDGPSPSLLSPSGAKPYRAMSRKGREEALRLLLKLDGEA